MLALTLPIPAFAKDSKGQEIPFETSRVFGLILVSAKVDGKPAVLIVDSGSSRTIISLELGNRRAHALGPPSPRAKARAGPAQESQQKQL
jgi:hypothetical protein